MKETPHPTFSRWINRLPYLLFLTVVVFYASSPFSLLDFPLDDAWIHRVYSQSFAHGHGFAYNPGQQEAGSTSPLWSIITAPTHWLEALGTDAVVLAVKFMGIILALFVIEATRRCGRNLGNSAIVGIIAASIVALDPRLAFSALSGMETNLLLALWIGSALCLIEGRFFLATMLISLTPAARPEALVIFPFFAIAAIISALRGKLAIRRLMTLAILPVPMLIWSLFCKCTNGHWLPTTFYMKSKSMALDVNQLGTAWSLLGLHGPLPALIVILLSSVGAYSLLRWHRHAEILLLTLTAPLVYLVGVLLSRKFFIEGYYWLRWSDPATILITATAAIGLGIAAVHSKGWKTRSATVLLLLFTLPHLANAMLSWRTRLISDCRVINLITIQAGKWMDANLPEDAVIAVNDAGATRYFGKRRTIDLMGLNCADIAFGTMTPNNTGIIDYLAITPTWFVGKGLYDGMPVCTNFSVAAEEYTITPNKGQREIVIFKCR